MKKIIIGILMIMMMISVQGAITIKASVNTNIELYCYNATSGALLGSSATLTCKDSSLTADINGVTLTNIAAGRFNYTFSLTEDTYACLINCPAGALDTSLYIESRPDYVQLTDILSDSTAFHRANLYAAISTRSSHSAADVWTSGTRDITGGTADTCTDVTNAVTTDTFSGTALQYQQDQNNTVDAIRTTDVPTITSNQATIVSDISEINDTVKDSTFGLEAIKNLINGLNDITAADVWTSGTRTLTSLGSAVNDIFNGIIGISGKNLNETIGDIYNVTITIQDGKTANWSATGTTSVTVNATQIWNENISNDCSYNSSFNPDTAGRYLCDVWRFN